MIRYAVLAACIAAPVAAAQSTGGASAQVRLSGPSSFEQGDSLTVTVLLNGALSDGALGFAGWNIGVDVLGATIAGASYVTPASPLIDQNAPFTPGYGFEISGGTIELNEGLNAFDTASTPVFHTGGALVELYLDTTSSTGDISIFTRKGTSPLGAFTEALPGVGSFAFIGQDIGVGFGTHTSGTITYVVPAPASAALLGVGGLVATRRRR